MADSDPISDSTPNKRRKTDHTQSQGKAWDSQEDSGDDLFENYETMPTQPLQSQRKQLSYPASAFHSDMNTLKRPSAPAQRTYQPTQPTQLASSQTLQHITQPTQPLPPKRSTPPTSQVEVPRSSPAPASPQRFPVPVVRPFAKPRGGLLAASIGPAGTSFRAPPGAGVKKPDVVNLDSDEEDPPVPPSSDDETQGRSNIKPTEFKRGARGLDSTPNRSDKVSSVGPLSSDAVQESPQVRSYAPASSSTFSNLMANFAHDSSRPAPARRPTDDMASAYGGMSRAARSQMSQQRQTVPARALPVHNMVRYKTLHDVEDYSTRKRIREIQNVLTNESVQRCYDALVRTRGNVEEAKMWLVDEEEKDAPHVMDDTDELGTMSPVARRGIAISKSSQVQQSSQPVRAAAKQEVKSSKKIAERFTANQAVRKASMAAAEESDEEDAGIKVPRRRLQQGRRPRSPTPPSSPAQKLPQPKQRLQQKSKHLIVLSDDEESDSGIGRDESEEIELEPVMPTETAFDARLLKFFNECTQRDLAELSGMLEDAVGFVLSKRPFGSLDAIRTISTETKTGKASRARPIGDRIVDTCAEMWEGYEAVDDLVAECERIAKPIQKTLKGWGVGEGPAGELQLMNLDEAHDSGIGTPASSCPSDEAPATKSRKPKGNFIPQPDNMGEVELKDYQLVGLNWLKLMWEKRTSCILADDMGLGKTCQVISFLAQLQKEEVDGVHLIIVPGSTLVNWLKEFERFAPSLTVFPYYAGDKERAEMRERIEEEFATIDVVITTYDVAVKDLDNKFLRKQLQPAVCVFDEAHQLRNPKSQRYEQLSRIRADFRLLLTGTPLQNNLQELVAILAFIMPDLFAEKRESLEFIFKHKATTKDADHAALLSAERIARARTIMTPFILRRKKAQVLDLPTKHSRVEKCDMTSTQSTYYYELVDEAKRVMREKEVTTTAKSRAAAAKASSNIMMALRKAAIHPLLSRRLYTDKKIDKIVAELRKHDEFGSNPVEKIRDYLTSDSNTGVNLKGGDYALHKFCYDRDYLRKFALKKDEWMDCGKVQKFKELVTAYAANGDRLLVFSQFTTLMDILEAVLETLSIKFFRLDGSTKMEDRQNMIDQFYEDTSIPVFMLSTKAGGAGINLAAANKVIIFDSGFNPQDDIQAENRAHRVGQTREVEVVRLVSKGTIEEQIHALGESKLALDERVAGEGAATAAEDKEAEKKGEKMVEKLFLDSLQQKKEEGAPAAKDEKDAAVAYDIKDAFKAGLESSGVRVASKQAQF